MFQGGNIALAMAQFLGPKVGAVCVQVLTFAQELLLSVLAIVLFHLNQ